MSARERVSPRLAAALESELPGSLVVGRGNALFVAGWCFHPSRPIHRLSVRLGESTARVRSHSLPRADLYADPRDDPRGRSYRSGFWGVLPIEPGDSGERALELVASVGGGEEAVAELGRVRLDPELPYEPVDAEASWPRGPSSPRVCVCMTTYNPEPAYLRVQLDTLRAQTYPNWVCLVLDDASDAERYRATVEEIGDDPRFIVYRSDKRVGFYRNFERCLYMVPDDADLVALADQDDVWYPEKIEELVERLSGGDGLAFSDMRLVDGAWTVAFDTLWTESAPNARKLGAMLVANSVPGAGSLFRRELLDSLLPFPQRLGNQFHDHWLGVMALAGGELEFVDRPLYDYVRHQRSVLTTEADRRAELREAAALPGGLRGYAYLLRARRDLLKKRIGDALLRWRTHYFHDVCRVSLLATVAGLRAPAAPRRKRRALRRFAALERRVSALLQLLGMRLARIGRRGRTNGEEIELLKGVAWRRIFGLMARLRRSPRDRGRQEVAAPAPVAIQLPHEELQREAGL